MLRIAPTRRASSAMLPAPPSLRTAPLRAQPRCFLSYATSADFQTAGFSSSGCCNSADKSWKAAMPARDVDAI